MLYVRHGVLRFWVGMRAGVEEGWAHGNHGRHGMGADGERVVIRDGQVGKLVRPWVGDL